MFQALRFPSIDDGVRKITFATAIRWAGWALVDPLIPVFLFMFSESYLQTGLLASVYSVVFLLSIPIVSFITDHVRAKYVILAGLMIYPFIGLAYYFAGVYGAAALVALARGLNGISYALDATGRATYIRRHTPREEVGSAFGFFLIVTKFWRTAVMLLGIIAIKYFAIHELFLLIVPTSLIAFWIVSRVSPDECDYHKKPDWIACIQPRTYLRFIGEVVIWSASLKRLALSSFMLGFLASVVLLFAPIILYTEGVSLEKIIIFSVITSIPYFFSYYSGRVADRYGAQALPAVFFALALLVGSLAFFREYEHFLFIIFIFNVVVTLGQLIVDSEMTRYGDNRKYGTLSGAILEVGELSAVVGPIVAGFTIGAFGAPSTLLTLATVTVLVAAIGALRPMTDGPKRQIQGV